MPITLSDEIAELRRELKMRAQVYAGQRYAELTSRKRDELLAKQTHQTACLTATLARLEALVPQQTSLF